MTRSVKLEEQPFCDCILCGKWFTAKPCSACIECRAREVAERTMPYRCRQPECADPPELELEVAERRRYRQMRGWVERGLTVGGVAPKTRLRPVAVEEDLGVD